MDLTVDANNNTRGHIQEELETEIQTLQQEIELSRSLQQNQNEALVQMKIANNEVLCSLFCTAVQHYRVEMYSDPKYRAIEQ